MHCIMHHVHSTLEKHAMDQWMERVELVWSAPVVQIEPQRFPRSDIGAEITYVRLISGRGLPDTRAPILN